MIEMNMSANGATRTFRLGPHSGMVARQNRIVSDDKNIYTIKATFYVAFLLKCSSWMSGKK